jgi:hypothetical protein
MSAFKKAVKSKAKLRMAIAGPSGSGKTYTGLALATSLANGGGVALVDTEHGSASKYADVFSFDVLEMHPPFHPDKFVQAINDAAQAGYDVIVLDSLTHAWSGTGGMLDIVDEMTKRSQSKNSYMAWKDGTPIQNKLIDSIVGAPIHVIATMRSKQDFVQEKDDRGKTTIKKVGMAPQQRDGFEYEFDVVFDMDIDNNGIVSKTRCPALNGRVFGKPGRDVANILVEWLDGEPVQPEQSKGALSGNGNGNGGGGTQTTGNVGTPAPTVAAVPAGTEWMLWTSAADAKVWAVECGACENPFEANNSFAKVVTDQFAGKFTTGNKTDVFKVFHEHQMQKLENKAEKAAADVDFMGVPGGTADDNPFEDSK